MALVIEAMDESGPCGLPAISVAHYGEQNGDAMRNPEMCFDLGIAQEPHLTAFYYRNEGDGQEKTCSLNPAAQREPRNRRPSLFKRQEGITNYSRLFPRRDELRLGSGKGRGRCGPYSSRRRRRSSRRSS
jgi:hypothetical protein